MFTQNLLLLTGAIVLSTSARVIWSSRMGMTLLGGFAQDDDHVPVELRRQKRTTRGDDISSVTSAAANITVAIYNPQSVSSVISSASVVDSNVVLESIQDEPTGGSHHSGPVTFSQPVYLSAIVESLSDNLWTTIATTTIVESDPITIEINVPITASRKNTTSSTTSRSTTWTPTTRSSAGPRTTTSKWEFWTGNVTITPSPNETATTKQLQERQTCSLIFAEINGIWASWCNNWDGSEVISYTSWSTTTILSSVVGASPPPASVVQPGTSTTTVTSATATSTISVRPISPISVSLPTYSLNPVYGSTASVITTDITLTMSSTVVTPVTTIMTPVILTSGEPSKSTASGSSSIPVSPSCGQVGDFVIGFDDLPSYTLGNNTNNNLSPEIFNPYDHFFWSVGYGYGPPPNEPYTPNSGTVLAQYNPADVPLSAQGSSDIMPGSFGDGPRAGNNIYWFNARYAWVGCNNTGTGQPCDFMATAYRHQSAVNGTPVGQEILIKTQHYFPPTCTSKQGCSLTQIYFDGAYFSTLSSLHFYATVNGVEVGYYVDTLALSWWNNSCSAGQIRASSK